MDRLNSSLTLAQDVNIAQHYRPYDKCTNHSGISAFLERFQHMTTSYEHCPPKVVLVVLVRVSQGG